MDLDGFFGFHPRLAPLEPFYRAAARDRPRLRLSRRHAFALRRAGLHGDGNSRGEEHDRRLAQSLPARPRAPGGDAVPRGRRRAAAAAVAPGPRAGARHRPDRPVRHPGRPEHRDDAVVVRERVCGCRRSRAQHHQPRRVRRDSHAQGHGPGTLCAGQRRRLPGVAIRAGAETDRAIDQGRPRARDRVRRIDELGSPRQRRRRDRAARHPSRRPRPRHRRAREISATACRMSSS